MTIAHIFNGELGFDVRTKLNDLIDLVGGGAAPYTPGIIPFADGSGFLTQDTGFFWDNANNLLTIGNGLNFGSARALYRIPAADDNWFAGGAGNLTLSGAGNFGFGGGALASVSTGAYNAASGTVALNEMTSGGGNFALGIAALRHLTTGNRNAAIGSFAIQKILTGADNVAIGDSALSNNTLGANANVAIGASAGLNMALEASYNVLIGPYIGYNWGYGNYNTVIGPAYAALNITGGYNNTLIGAWRGPAAVMSNVIAFSDGGGGPGGNLLMDYNYTTAGFWTAFGNFTLSTGFGYGVVPKAGAPAAGDLTSGTFLVIDDTSAGQTWLVFNKAGTIRKVQLT